MKIFIHLILTILCLITFAHESLATILNIKEHGTIDDWRIVSFSADGVEQGCEASRDFKNQGFVRINFNRTLYDEDSSYIADMAARALTKPFHVHIEAELDGIVLPEKYKEKIKLISEGKTVASGMIYESITTRGDGVVVKRGADVKFENVNPKKLAQINEFLFLGNEKEVKEIIFENSSLQEVIPALQKCIDNTQ